MKTPRYICVIETGDNVNVIGRVPSVLADGRVCHSYDSDRFSHINTVLLIVN